jgi:hypothetical protein
MIEPLAGIGRDEWDAVVRGSPDGWVFGLHGWQSVVTGVDAWDYRERGFGLRDNGRLAAVMPLHFRPSQKVTGSSGWGGAGPIVAGGLTPENRRKVYAGVLAHAAALARADNSVRLDISMSPVTASSLASRRGVNPLELAGFKDTSLLSQVIRLDTDEALWAGLSKTARNLIRRARTAGYRAAPADWTASLDAYYDIHAETYARTGVRPHPRQYFAGIAAHVAPAGASRLLAALSPAGEPVAFHNTAYHGPGAVYHTGCSRDAVQADSLGYLLMWEALREARAAGAGWYDCGWIFPAATDPKQKGLTLFKTRFGGEPHRSFRAELALESAAAPEPSAPPPAAGQRSPARRLLAKLGAAGRRLKDGKQP